MGDENKEETLEPGATELIDEVDDQDFDAAFNEQATTEKSADAEDKTTEIPAKEEQPKATEEPEPVEDKKPPSVEEQLAALNKRIEDQQAGFTRISQENAELKKQLEAKATEKKEDEIPDEIKALMDDYPEMTKIVEFFMKKNADSGAPQTDLSEQITQYQQQHNFEMAVMAGYAIETGDWVEGHSDAIKIFNSKPFQEFCKTKKADGNVTAAQAITLITEYKKDHIKTAVKEHDTAITETGKKTLEVLKGGVKSTNSGGRSTETKEDKNDFDKAWDEASK